MSQKKVDERKEYKKNRKENIRKEQRQEKIGRATVWIVAAIFVIGVGIAAGVSIHNRNKAQEEALPTYNTSDFVLNDLAGIREEDAEETEQKKDAEEAKTEAQTGEAAAESAAQEEPESAAEE